MSLTTKKALTRKKPLRAKKPMRSRSIPASSQRQGIYTVPEKKGMTPKRAYTRAKKRPQATPAEQAHMDAVASLACDACEQDGTPQPGRTCIHHIREGYGCSQRASHWETLPECEGHHQGMRDTTRPVAFHKAPRTFQARYGSEIAALKRTWDKLGLDFNQLPAIVGKTPPWWKDYLRGKFDDVLPEDIRNTLTTPKEEP